MLTLESGKHQEYIHHQDHAKHCPCSTTTTHGQQESMIIKHNDTQNSSLTLIIRCEHLKQRKRKETRAIVPWNGTVPARSGSKLVKPHPAGAARENALLETKRQLVGILGLAGPQLFRERRKYQSINCLVIQYREYSHGSIFF